MKKKLSEEGRKKMEELLAEANKQGETRIGQLVKLALHMSDQGRYDEFRKLFSKSH